MTAAMRHVALVAFATEATCRTPVDRKVLKLPRRHCHFRPALASPCHCLAMLGDHSHPDQILINLQGELGVHAGDVSDTLCTIAGAGLACKGERGRVCKL